MSEQVIHNPQESRYEMTVEGHLSVADYVKAEGGIAVTHVEVPQALRGKGIAAKLMEGLLTDAKERGWAVTPICSYAAAYMQRHG